MVLRGIGGVGAVDGLKRGNPMRNVGESSGTAESNHADHTSKRMIDVRSPRKVASNVDSGR